MELRLQQFIESVEQLSDIRNLDQWNPIVFQLEHPVTATRYTIVGSKQEPSYLGLPVNVTWVVLDPQSPYYRQALKLVDVNDPDKSTTLPPVAVDSIPPTSLYWNLIRTYDEIFSVPQYYSTGNKGPKGDKGDPGDPGSVDYNLAIATLATLTGTLSIVGPNSLNENSVQQYSLSLTEPQVLPDGTITAPQTTQVTAPIMLLGNVPAGTYMDGNNVLHVGAITSDVTIQMYATYPSWAKAATAYADVALSGTPLTVTGVTLSGPNAVNSGTQNQYTVNVAWSDGSTTHPAAAWSLDSTSFGTISSGGVLDVPANIASSGSVNVSATVVINGVTFMPNQTVVVTKQSTVTVSSVTVTGPNNIDSGTSGQFSVNVNWSDGSTTHPSAAWSLNTSVFGSINGSGLMTVPDTISSSGAVTVTATLTIDGVTYTPTASCNITKINVVLTVTGVTISGAGSVVNGSNTQYQLVASWSNGSTTNPAADSWTLDVPDFGTISASGMLSVPSNLVTGGTVTINSSVTINGTTYTPSLAVTVSVVDVSLLAPYYGTGPALPTDWQTFITGLTQYPDLTVDGKYQLSIDAIGAQTFMYFAYPQSHGEATFFDKLSQFFGGFGGAGNPGAGPSTLTTSNYRDMPITQTINVGGVDIPFYVYRSDYANLGAAAGNQWEVTLTTP